MRPWRIRELQRRILREANAFAPDVIMVYKGNGIGARLIERLRVSGRRIVNVYPDYSPHAFGAEHREAVGKYDLVISTKPYHPAAWREVYGYENRCVFVPHGYDSRLHLVPTLPHEFRFDIALVATWGSEYGALMRELANLLPGATVVVGGSGWSSESRGLPKHWVFTGAVHGPQYVELLRSARICLAPVRRHVVIDGVAQPGDEDTTRTYELAAAHCFFLHRWTEYVRLLYDEQTEVPLYASTAELVEMITYFLQKGATRAQMAAAAHRRAVPQYSIDSRAAAIMDFLHQ